MKKYFTQRRKVCKDAKKIFAPLRDLGVLA